MFVSATVALDPQKPIFQAATSEVIVEPMGDESMQLGTLFRYMAQESGQMVLNNRVERCFFWLVSAVADETSRLNEFGLGID